MPDALAQALALPGLGWLIGAAIAAGLVRGFAGFGTAMIYMPVAGAILDPFVALISLVVMDLLGPLPTVPRALRDRHKGDMGKLIIGLVFAMPFGVWLLGQMDPTVFRYAVSLIALILLILLISGYRYQGQLTSPTLVGTGMLGGVMGGSMGLAGPPVIMLYMASTHPAQVVRATLMLYLLSVDILLINVMWVMDRLDMQAIVVGFVVTGPYLLSCIAGAAVFRAERELAYRRIAYGIIAASAIGGLPLWEI